MTRASAVYYRCLAILWFAGIVLSAAAMWAVGFWFRYAPVIALSLAVVLVMIVTRLGVMGCR